MANKKWKCRALSVAVVSSMLLVACGTSTYTVTVGTYNTSADFSGASTVSAFDDYAVDRPESL